jgi:hypothetical protein
MVRILVGGLLGGIVMFLWGFVSHQVLKLSESSVRSIPVEPVVTTAMKLAINQPGFYFFPGMDMSHEPTAEEQKDWEQRHARGPTGVLVIHPQGKQYSLARNLGLEFVSNLMAALVVALMVSQMSGVFPIRAAAGAGFGLFSWLSISASYAIWYSFPADFTQAEAIDQVVGWLLAGVAIAAVSKPSAA